MVIFRFNGWCGEYAGYARARLSVGWSIAVEWRIYIIFPLLIRLLRRVHLLVFVVLMTCIATAIHFVTNYTILKMLSVKWLALTDTFAYSI